MAKPSERMVVRLAPAQIREAERLGLERYFLDLRAGRKQRPEHKRDQERHIADHKLGSVCELVLAMGFHVPWDGPGTLGLFGAVPDQMIHALGVQVRGTKGLKNRLIIRPEDLRDEDHRNAPYVLVIDQRPQFIIVGWRYGYEAKELGQFTNFGDPTRDKAWAISQSKLRPMSTLPNQRREDETSSVSSD